MAISYILAKLQSHEMQPVLIFPNYPPFLLSTKRAYPLPRFSVIIRSGEEKERDSRSSPRMHPQDERDGNALTPMLHHRRHFYSAYSESFFPPCSSYLIFPFFQLPRKNFILSPCSRSRLWLPCSGELFNFFSFFTRSILSHPCNLCCRAFAWKRDSSFNPAIGIKCRFLNLNIAFSRLSVEL